MHDDRRRTARTSRIVMAAAALLLASGCSSLMSSATSSLADSLTVAVLDQNDPETVRQGAPAYLLLIDGLIADNPESSELLLAGAGLYSSYAGAFVEEPERASRLSRKHVRSLYGAGAAWGTWIRANVDDWSAIADKARVDAIMQRVVVLDETYDDGSPFLYLGILATLLPEAAGGRPEEGRAFFERAIELSDGRNLMAKVLLARAYARLVFDRELHDRLCREVVEADPVAPGLTLTNTMAQEEARELLGSSEEYFGE